MNDDADQKERSDMTPIFMAALQDKSTFDGDVSDRQRVQRPLLFLDAKIKKTNQLQTNSDFTTKTEQIQTD
ncbi:hypothetical protein AC249_AIPGENE20859 [Exaiptasia diaphana]|nr:hypothetical protein AC249_AIPGENE20859 [Exaiptasia diaphana]